MQTPSRSSAVPNLYHQQHPTQAPLPRWSRTTETSVTAARTNPVSQKMRDPFDKVSLDGLAQNIIPASLTLPRLVIKWQGHPWAERVHTGKAFFVPMPNTHVKCRTYCPEAAKSDGIKKVVMQALKDPLEGSPAIRRPMTPKPVIKAPTQIYKPLMLELCYLQWRSCQADFQVWIWLQLHGGP